MTTESESTFPELLASHQPRIYSYVVSLIGDATAAWDVLQETNRVLLEKQAQFQLGTSFVNWSLTVAQFQTMAWLRDAKRDRLLATPEIVELMADEAEVISAGEDDRKQALHHCLESLSNGHRDLIHWRYVRSESLVQLAKRSGRTVNALKQLFFRLRGSLAKCVEQKMETS
jgi:RNA polymerase sigma-70 factor (ECF subfamily)